ncbi:transcriptional regulator [Methylobacterium sp. Leaf456]|uniref:hypothetical protein n=1 Tax=Methylobacterium sp. Leaf456 TaxID=1736382 RepID=UPI0006FFB8A5|nr:hypothetical protein [Methylobacterium sp. Leaf456]KQT45382.1 transcriptional regulator [Methylobacterium sp. Leaf456]
MAHDLKLSPDLQARIDAVAARAGRPAGEVIADALEHGHSLEWQERFVETVRAGIEDADVGRFATPADIERVLNKYRPSREPV